MSKEAIEQIAAYLGLLVTNAGGEIRVPYSVVEEGLPNDHGVRIINDEENEELVFVIQELPKREQ